MKIITVKDVISNYQALDIAKRLRCDSERLMNGMLEIFANYGLKVRITVPQSNSLKLIKKHYGKIVQQVNWNSQNGKPLDFGFTNTLETVFYSKEKYSDLCLVDNEQR